MHVFLEAAADVGALYATCRYFAYNEGLKQDIFLKDVKGQPYVGQVWPGDVHFPDFMHEKGIEYWHDQIKVRWPRVLSLCLLRPACA